MKRTRFYLLLLVAVTASSAAEQSSNSRPAAPVQAVAGTRATTGGPTETDQARYLTRMLFEQTSGISRNITARSLAEQAVLVVPTARMEAETSMQLGEDMNIMCRVMDRLLASSGLKLRDWPPFVPEDQRRATRGVYLPGFGAVLLVEVDFPLVAPPEDTPEPDVRDEADALWSEVRQEMRGQPAPMDAGREADSRPPYDDLKVEGLKRTFLTALKHASNIRGLNPADQVLAVAINAVQPGVPPDDVFATTYSPYGMERQPAGPSSPQLLALRATKAQVDDYARGTLTPEQFGKKTSVIDYDLSTVENAAPPTR